MMGNKEYLNIKSSFRDPSGFVLMRDGYFYRQVNLSYKDHFDQLMNYGLYEVLVGEGLLIPHIETDFNKEIEGCYKIFELETIPFVSYPYEWSFSQLKDAALTTLKIQRMALKFGMTLKDASAYNIQFRNGKPILIDTLSFEIYKEGGPWVAYKQFCQHFIAPLALMSFKDIRLNQLFRIYIDGIPLDLASALLPFRTYLKFSLLSHIHLHAKSQKHFGDKVVNINNYRIRSRSFLGLIDNLESTVKTLKLQDKSSLWANYYENNNYSQDAIEHKKKIVAEFLDKVNPKNVWDFGANKGIYSRIASNKGIQTISFDIDPVAVNKNYLECVKNGETKILPLLIDLVNPSPGIGWDNQERMSIYERGPAELLMVLALIHHLVIANNVAIEKLAEFFHKYCNWLIIEFIPKNDSNVIRLLRTRKDIFPDYTEIAFRNTFSKLFKIIEAVKIRDSERIIYLMKNT